MNRIVVRRIGQQVEPARFVRKKRHNRHERERGLHPAFALVPIVPFLPHEPRRLDLLADPPDDDAVHHVEHEWNAAVQVILLLFGLVNGGVALRGYDTGTWAILLAALVGRPMGIVASVGLAVAAGW